ncbi:hypothetical protein [Streptomyces sp. NPDC058665]|uniref:hypothetical protein n=1 Tax=Streptomyces sp. NPDC058665 TaxID=3346586 RepID=UPI00365D8301
MAGADGVAAPSKRLHDAPPGRRPGGVARIGPCLPAQFARLVREGSCRAVDEGDLPPETDPGLLARYVTTLAFGIAVQAASGVCRDELRAMTDAALRNWPL